MERTPTWAIVSPAPLDALQALAREDDEDIEPLELIRGSGAHHALVCHEPGADAESEAELVLALSAAHPGVHYLLQFDEEFPWVFTFENGQRTSSSFGDPRGTAEQLGVPLVPEPEPSPKRQGLLVTGRTRADVLRALGIEKPAPDSPLRFAELERGTLVSSTLGALDGDEISEQLDAVVYALHFDPEAREFSCSVYEKGEEIGVFEEPRTEIGTAPRLSEILGESTPERILAVLGVPW